MCTSFFRHFFYCCSSTVVSIFLPPLSPTPPITSPNFFLKVFPLNITCNIHIIPFKIKSYFHKCFCGCRLWGWGYFRFFHLNDFELNDVLLLEANNKGNLIFQHLELFVLDSKATSFFPIFNPLAYRKEHNSEKQHQTDLVFVQRKILVLDSDFFFGGGEQIKAPETL